jgi:hypothetical protein
MLNSPGVAEESSSLKSVGEGGRNPAHDSESSVCHVS